MNFFGSVKDLFSLGSTKLLSAVINSLFWFYFASTLPKDDYGQLGFLISLGTVGHAISILGLGTVMVVHGSKDEKIIHSSYKLGIISSAIASLGIFAISRDVFASLLVISMSVFILMTSEINSKQKYRIYSTYTLAQKIIQFLLAIILYPFFGFIGVIAGISFSYLLGLRNIFKLKIYRSKLDSLKPKLQSMTNNYIIGLNQILFWWGDKLIIGSLFNFEVLGNYQIATHFLLVLYTIPSATFVYLVPQESKGIKNKKIKIYSVLLSIVISIISIISIPFFIDSFLPKYHESILAMQIMSLAIIPIAISMIYESEYIGKDTSRIVLIGSTAQTGLYFLLLIVLGNVFGLIGFALGFLISSIFRSIFNFIMKRFVNFIDTK